MDLLAAAPMDFEIEPVQVHLERLAQIKRALLAERPQERPSTQTLSKEIPSETPPVNTVKSNATPKNRPTTSRPSGSAVSNAQQVVRSWHQASQASQAKQDSDSQ
jgi:hypothetical protein